MGIYIFSYFYSLTFLHTVIFTFPYFHNFTFLFPILPYTLYTHVHPYDKLRIIAKLKFQKFISMHFSIFR